MGMIQIDSRILNILRKKIINERRPDILNFFDEYIGEQKKKQHLKDVISSRIDKDLFKIDHELKSEQFYTLYKKIDDIDYQEALEQFINLL